MTRDLPFGLTAQQGWCLLAIQELTELDGRPPTMRELARELGIASLAHTHALLVALRDRGRITWLPRCGRSLTVLAPAPMPEEPGLELTPAAHAALAAEVGR